MLTRRVFAEPDPVIPAVMPIRSATARRSSSLVMLYLLNIELVRWPLTFMLWRGIRPRRLRERRGIGDTAGVALWRRCHVMHRKDCTRSARPRHKCEPGEVPHALAKLRGQTTSALASAGHESPRPQAVNSRATKGRRHLAQGPPGTGGILSDGLRSRLVPA